MDAQTYRNLQLTTQAIYTALVVQAVYQLAALGIPLAAASRKPSTDDVWREFILAGREYGVKTVTENKELRGVAFITGQDVEVNPQSFLNNYEYVFGSGDWQYWKRYVHRVMIHEVGHPSVQLELAKLGCFKIPQDVAEYRTQWLLEDWYIERIMLKDFPIPPLEKVHRSDWTIFRPKGTEEVHLIIMAPLSDLEREFGDTPLPEMKRLCMQIRQPEDICKVYDKIVALYDKALKEAMYER